MQTIHATHPQQQPEQQPGIDDSNGLPMEHIQPQPAAHHCSPQPEKGFPFNLTYYRDSRPGREAQTICSFLWAPTRSPREAEAIISEYTAPNDNTAYRTTALAADEWPMVLDCMLDHLAKSMPNPSFLEPENDVDRAQLEDWRELNDAINTVRAHLMESNFGSTQCKIPF